MVFEIGFESLQESPGINPGFAVRFPRMLRWRRDKTPLQADRMEEIRQMLRTMSGVTILREKIHQLWWPGENSKLPNPTGPSLNCCCLVMIST